MRRAKDIETIVFNEPNRNNGQRLSTLLNGKWSEAKNSYMIQSKL